MDFPCSTCGTNRLSPLSEAAFLTPMDLLAVADQPDQGAPPVDPLASPNQHIGLARIKLTFHKHLLAIPRPLRFIEYDEMLRRRGVTRAVRVDRFVQVLHEHSAGERILENGDERAVARKKRRGSVLVLVLIDNAKPGESFPGARDARDQYEDAARCGLSVSGERMYESHCPVDAC